VNRDEPTPISGIRYYTGREDAVLIARDGLARVFYGDLPIPLLERDYNALGGSDPTYDAVGRGVYQALRSNPDCTFGPRYAGILKDAYPHYLAELAGHLLMLEKKDLDPAYLDRKIACLKILFLMEPANAILALEIGRALQDKGTSLAVLHQASVVLYRAEEYLMQAVELSPESTSARYHLGEVSYLLGKYDNAASLWRGLLTQVSHDQALNLEERLGRLAEGKVPRVPVSDYLEAAGVGIDFFQHQEWEEAAAILHDVLDDDVLQSEYPLPELWYFLALCCSELNLPGYAEEYLKKALELNPDYGEARQALAHLDQ
jgi:tetratricopeptide (TPR) repeat protein